jgi:XTP/dITP diphosphohydrolase
MHTEKEKRKMKTIVVATKNRDKIREIQEMLAGSDIHVLSLAELGIDQDVEETGTTFEENAVLKAEAGAKAIAQLPQEYIVIADDSGLEIDYFDGKPGIYSSRWLGVDTSYEVKNRQILEQMADVPEEKRGARYVCAIAAAKPSGVTWTVRETFEGQIAHEAKGSGGFGYDPIIWLPSFGCTVAELPPEEKNAISHRGKALRAMFAKLRQEGELG